MLAMHAPANPAIFVAERSLPLVTECTSANAIAQRVTDRFIKEALQISALQDLPMPTLFPSLQDRHRNEEACIDP